MPGQYLSTDPNAGETVAPGLLVPGNIDLQHRPRVTNPDGSISTVRSIGVNIDGREVLLPTVSDDGRLLSNADAIALYKKTGKHLGIFDSPAHSTTYAQQLHEDQAAQLDGYLSTDPGVGEPVRPSMQWAIVNGQRVPVGDDTETPPPQTVGHFVEEAIKPINPIEMAKGVGQAVLHPLDTAQAVYGAQMAQFDKGGAELATGRTSEGLGHLAAGLIPIIGPAAAAAGEQMASGDVAGGAGAGVGQIASVFAPRVLKAIVPARAQVRVLPRLIKPNLNAAEQAAVDFGQSVGIPIDAATATGNRFVRGTQRVADESLLGSRTSATTAQTEALTRTGRGMASHANGGGAAADAVSAGEAVGRRLERRINTQARVADRAYGQLRQLEQQQTQRVAQTGGVRAPATSAQPFTHVPLAVDVSAAKQSLQSLYQALSREKELVGTLQGGKARTLVALDALMHGPDMAPLSVVDGALGDLKAMARTNDLPALRTQGQAAAAEAVKALEAQVTATARAAGRDVYAALQRGRQATIGKYKTAAVRELLDVDEPAKVFQQLTQQKDLGLERLRAVAQQTPREIPKVARAYLDGLMDTATAEGSFAHADKLWSEWQKLGAETKQILFKDPTYIQDLDRFFLLAKRIAENPNPSGTAWTFTKTGEVTLLLTNPAKGVPVSLTLGALSKLLHSPAGVRALTRGLSVGVQGPVTRAARVGVAGQMTRVPAAAATARENREGTPSPSAPPRQSTR